MAHATQTASMIFRAQIKRRSKTMKILMVMTSHEQAWRNGKKTGFCWKSFAAPYYTFAMQVPP